MKRISLFLMSLVCCALVQAQKKPAPQLFIPMDYSTCGYRASETAIPDVAVGVYVTPVAGDNSERIQQAIDYLSGRKADINGSRGAVLLGEGTFCLDKPLRIKTSGIVLRGMGREKTTLVKRGVDRGAMIYIEGGGTYQVGDRINIVDKKVKAGSCTFTVASATSLRVGDRVQITRPSTAEWIQSLNMEDFGGGLNNGWKPTDIDITWDRTVVAVEGSKITVDAPLTTTLSEEYGSGVVVKGYNIGEITECGIENLSLESAVNDWNEKDEDHCWDAVWMENVRDAWVRRVHFEHFAGSAVNLQKHTSRITVEDCVAKNPVSELGGWRRMVFTTRGQQTLFQRCASYDGMHDFTAGTCAAGPNAFVQCDAINAHHFSGSVGSWAAGLLFDIVNIEGHDLHLGNLETYNMGTGWNTANSMLWQCTASTLWCYSPDEDNRCSAHGAWGTFRGNSGWTNSNAFVNPFSLFYDQLAKRIGREVDGHILRHEGIVTTSPTVEQAMEMAQASLTQPRVTMEMWIDKIPFTASLSSDGVPSVDHLKKAKVVAEPAPKTLAVKNGMITLDNKLITGNQYDIPWWSGSVKDNFIRRGARPAITRFVPGREGTGWTDRIDSVVTHLKNNGFTALYHHYGLWYDLRRTDHERVRRADGEVCPPFYEQAFARSGEGTAFDGLSRYDLTKPNKWYWSRLREFATKGLPYGIMLFNQHYFQHNILEAGAHWVDCPWRPVNNINGTDFPEPVPFAGDKRIFIAEQFYNEKSEALGPLHKQYIRHCLEELADQPNVIHMISGEYSGPLHFTRFWLETVAEWEQETGKHPLIAISCTKDAQDELLADPVLSKVIDVIDIRYWHYNTKGLWASAEGKNMAPRQWIRRMPLGSVGFNEVYKAVREYRDRYPEKAVLYYSPSYNTSGWAVLMAGGSLPNLRINNEALAEALPTMRPADGNDCLVLGNADKGYVVYTRGGQPSLSVAPGQYRLYEVSQRSGDVKMIDKAIKGNGTLTIPAAREGTVYWLERR